METPDCDVCRYIATIEPSCGFLAFRAGLARIKLEALKAACEHRISSSSVIGLQVRDHFIDLLWENCCLPAQTAKVPIVAPAKSKRVNGATMQLNGPNVKKNRTDNVPVDVSVTMGDIQVIPSLLDKETTASNAVVANLESKVTQICADNQKFADIQQQLIETQKQLAMKHAQLDEVIKRLQSQQNVCDRLVCTVYDRQRSFGQDSHK